MKGYNMKRIVYDSDPNKNNETKGLILDDIPSIANRWLTFDQVINWLDRLVEVHENETDLSN